VPAVATGSVANFNGTSGTSDWVSFVKYYFVDFDDRTRGQLRLEAFYDSEGSRTGFEGWYYAATLGAVLKPTDWTIFRPEIRYDFNNYSRPFEGKHGLFTAAADLIFKF
jgi:Putative beta-barrel porin-2, OmpL-like. bbp2